jgi:hypothetical protein
MSLDKVKLSQLNNINDIPDEALIYVVVGGVSYRTTKAAFLAGIGGGGVTLFTALTDTPASYTGQAGKVLAVKVGEDGLEFVPLPGASVPNLQQVLEQGNQSNIALQFSETSPVIFAEDENGNQMTLSTENLIFLYNDLSQIFLQGGELIFENTAIPNSSATFGFVYPTTSPTTFAYGISQQWVGSVGTRALSLILTDPGVAGRKNLFTPALSQDETIATREWANATFNNHFKGLYANLAALETAHPTASPGDYAIVDAGVGADAVKYIWDNSDEQWVAGTGSSLGSTDDLAEGTINKYFTNERAQAAVDLSGRAVRAKWLRNPSDRTLTAQTALQAIFSPNSGGLTVENGKRYAFRLRMVGNSFGGSSQNIQFGALGTAVFSSFTWTSFSSKSANTNPATAIVRSSSVATSTALVNSNSNELFETVIQGNFTCSGDGTFIPSIGQGGTAVAGVIEAGAFIEVWEMGSSSVDFLN